MTKKQALKIVLLAGEMQAKGYNEFTCVALQYASYDVTYYFINGITLSNAYWYDLFAIPVKNGEPQWNNAVDRLNELGYKVAYRGKAVQKTRLLMLAFLYTMIENGEFTKITGYKFE